MNKCVNNTLHAAAFMFSLVFYNAVFTLFWPGLSFETAASFIARFAGNLLIIYVLHEIWPFVSDPVAAVDGSTAPRRPLPSFSKGPLYVAVDIEKTGPKFTKHDIIALGVAVGTEQEGLLYSNCWCFNHDALRVNPKGPRSAIEKHFDANTWDEFWSDKLPLLDRIRKQAKDQSVQGTWSAFGAFLDGLEDLYPDRDIVIVSDNPKFDVAHVDYQLETRLGRNPMNLTRSGRYCNTVDPSERVAATGYHKRVEDSCKRFFPHDHWPESDAKHILATFFVCQRLLREQVNSNEAHARIQEVLDREEPFFDASLVERKKKADPTA